MSEVVLETKKLNKIFGTNHVLVDIDLTVNKGDRIAIIGGSGSGKSTMLRCLNFMETPTSGEILLKGNTIGTLASKNTSGPQVYKQSEKELCSVRKDVGMVFQQFNLFPHMTVLQNVAEGLVQVKGFSKKAANERATKELERVGLGQKLGAFPSHLSGGQQQRVAIARSLAMDPEILLFDEPTSSLDPELVGEVLNVIRDLADEGRTMLLVTHELGFAYHFANRVLFFADGKFHEVGTPDEVLKNPQKKRTQEFIEQFSAFSF
ncbi:amino acid ABC transporter ATP-binding protein [Rhodanobacter aciditrophus]|uniref:Amino acid ABC transporter ATP-binding protein n=1 Tax=Rhodanobacter aciditrophus TaxID=1623218 RepID=A0ABW4B0Q9_9GAMM